MLARFKGFKEKYPYYWVSLYFVFYIFYLNLYYAFPTFSIANYIANWYAITFTITSLLSVSRFHYVSILMTNTSWLKLQQPNLHSNMFRL